MYAPGLRLLFVHIPKTGGESVAQALEPYGRFGVKHATYREFRMSHPALLPEVAQVACFVRNPWDQVVSFYSHLRKPAYLPKEQISDREDYFADGVHLHPLELSVTACQLEFGDWVRRWFGARRRHVRLARSEPLPAWLHARRARPALPTPDWYAYHRSGPEKYLLPPLEWIRDPCGRERASFIGRFESLAEDFARLAERLGIAARLPHLNRSQRQHDYRSYYDAALRDCIARYYAPEIERFGYQF